MNTDHLNRVTVSPNDLAQSPERWPGERFDLLTAYLSSDPEVKAPAKTFVAYTSARKVAERISDASRRWGLDETQTIAVLAAFYVGCDSGRTSGARDLMDPLPDWRVSDLCRAAAHDAARKGGQA